MLTLILEGILAPVTLAFGLVALAVYRRLRGEQPAERLGWWLTGIVFTASGVSETVQSVWAAWAYFAGAGTPVYASYLRWAPAANLSRSGVSIVFSSLLLLQQLAPTWRRAGQTLFLLALAGGLVGGAALGVLEGSYTSARHHSVLAVLNVAEMIALLAALLIAVMMNRMDWLLWAALALYALNGALNAIWISAMAWLEVPGMWAPEPWMAAAYMLTLTTAMLLLARHRLRLARRGVQVPGLLQLGAPRAGATTLLK